MPERHSTQDFPNWSRIALAMAAEACQDNFPSLYGVRYFPYLDVICVLSNISWAGFPKLRDQALAKFRKALKAEGVEELAFATFPPPDTVDAGDTLAMLLKAGADREQWAKNTWMRILLEPLEKMMIQRAPPRSSKITPDDFEPLPKLE